MRSNLACLLIILGMFSLNLCGQEADVKELIESTGEKMSRAVIAGDFEMVLSFFTEDMIVDPIFQPVIKGKKAYWDEVKKMEEKGIRYQSLTGTPVDIWACGDRIYDRGTFGMSLITRESSQPVAFYGSYFQIWQKQSDGSYKIQYMISNLDFNPFEK
jgi:ketosteroid isomerase-like protein